MNDWLIVRTFIFLLVPSSTSKGANDLLDLQPAFQQPLPLSTNNTWGGESSTPFILLPLSQTQNRRTVLLKVTIWNPALSACSLYVFNHSRCFTFFCKTSARVPQTYSFCFLMQMPAKGNKRWLWTLSYHYQLDTISDMGIMPILCSQVLYIYIYIYMNWFYITVNQH